jgi:L-lactate dehydrogenase complex protein LldE
VTDLGARYPHKVTLHNGCHTRRELGVVEPPLELLKKVRDLEYRELPNVEECCGFGGTFSVKMPGTSLAMGQTKAANIVRSGADVVVSPDISCLMHIGGILRRNPATRHIRTLHIAEVLVAEE